MSTTSNGKENTCKERYKILIIGGGIAGLSSAFHLTKNGETDFKVLEALDRIGGRINTISMGGTPVELGAGWIHGILGNPVYDLALDAGLVRLDGTREPHAVVATTEEGKRVPISVVEEVYGAYFWFCKRCEEYFLLGVPTPSETCNSVGRHLETDIVAYLERFPVPEERSARRLVFDHLLNRETCITGSHSMDETSLADFGSYTELPGGNVTIPSGFTSLLESLLRRLPEESVLTDHPVQAIRWKKGLSTEVECSDGRSFVADHVVVTLPLGVLKETAIFDPPLPEYKLQCIKRLSFGVVNKIYLEYEVPFLNPDISEIITLWGPTLDVDMEKTWFRKIYSFSRFKEKILLAWVSGREAEFLETLSDAEVGDTCTMLLRRFLADPYVPKPSNVIRTKWRSQPYIRGSYTTIGTNSSQHDIDLLAKSIYADPFQNKPVLLFAGEATHSSFYSTVHGAYLSGLRASQVLLQVEEESDADLSSWLTGIDLS